MRKLLLFSLLLVVVMVPVIADRNSRGLALAPYYAQNPTTVNASAAKLDGSGLKLAFKFYADSALAIKNMNCSVAVTGADVNIKYHYSIQADSAQLPSGTNLAATATSFAGPGSAGTQWLGEHAFSADTGTLTLNAAYWGVISHDAGSTAPDATHYIQLRNRGIVDAGKTTRWNGASWDAVATGDATCAVQLSDDTWRGIPVTTSPSATAATTIYTTNKQAISFRVGAPTKALGVHYYVTKASSPTDLVIGLWEGTAAAAKATITVTAADITDVTESNAYFSSKQDLLAGTTYYIQFSQSGGSGSAYYTLNSYKTLAAYLPAISFPYFRLLYGTAAKPSDLTASTTELPVRTFLIVDDPAADFSAGAGGGTSACGYSY